MEEKLRGPNVQLMKILAKEYEEAVCEKMKTENFSIQSRKYFQINSAL